MSDTELTPEGIVDAPVSLACAHCWTLKSRCRTCQLSGLQSYAEQERRKGAREALLDAETLSIETLEFYADPHTYFAVGFFADPPNGDFMDDFSETEELGSKPGRRAREALLKLDQRAREVGDGE